MKDQPTVKQKNQFSKSLGSGMKSVFGSAGRTFFVLEHRTHTARHKAGEVQEIIVDYIEMGRDPKCQVRFADDTPTVSRRHAAIAKEGENWVIRHLGSVNPTLVNGRPISRQWFLQNGDEFQLSVEGPKIGFIIPPNNSVKSIGLSRRLSLFGQQAMKPYKRAITVLAFMFVFAIAALSYGIWNAQQETKKARDEIGKMQLLNSEQADSLKGVIAENKELQQEMAGKLGRMEQRIKGLIQEQNRNRSADVIQEPSPGINAQLAALYSKVYRIQWKSFSMEYEGETITEEINEYIGTGFLLSNGKFVSARHVLEPWYFVDESHSELLLLNAYLKLGARITADFVAEAPGNRSISFTNNDYYVDRSNDQEYQIITEEGETLVLQIASLNSSDWARINTSESGGLAFDPELSNNLSSTTKLHVLGYPLGMAALSGGTMSPIYGNCVVGADGLQDGVILISARNFEHGNSGGPVFAERNAQWFVVGLISAGSGQSIGYIVPVSAVR